MARVHGWAGLRRRDIVGAEGTLYLRRWILLRTPLFAVYLHCFHRGDEDRELHDHPWPFVSFVLAGGYHEELPGERLVRRRPGTVIVHRATDAHRVLLPPGRRAWTLVITGRRVREWGFYAARGWVPWREFLGVADEPELERE